MVRPTFVPGGWGAGVFLGTEGLSRRGSSAYCVPETWAEGQSVEEAVERASELAESLARQS
jgi:hypothetical protein